MDSDSDRTVNLCPLLGEHAALAELGDLNWNIGEVRRFFLCFGSIVVNKYRKRPIFGFEAKLGAAMSPCC